MTNLRYKKTKKKSYSLAYLNDKKGVISNTLSGRWFVYFRAYCTKRKKMREKRMYDVNKFKTKKRRYAFAQKQIESINEYLINGYEFGTEDMVDTVKDSLKDVLSIIKARVSTKTHSSYITVQKSFCDFIGDSILLDQVKRKDIVRYRDKLLIEQKSIKTINQYMRVLKLLFEEMVEREWLEKNPIQVKSMRERQSVVHKVFSENRIAQLMPLIREKKMLSMLVQMMYYCFIRPNETKQLKVGNIDLERRYIFTGADISKAGKNDYVWIPKAFLPSIEDFVKGRASDEPLLLNKFGRAYKTHCSTMYDTHKRILDKFDWGKEHTLYSWKHTGVTHAFKAGANIYDIKMQCRHSCIKNTEKYMRELGLMLGNTTIDNIPQLG